MKQFKISFIILFALLISVVGCQKEENIFEEEQQTKTTSDSYSFQEEVKLNLKSPNSVKADVIIKSDNKELLNQNFSLIPVYEIEENTSLAYEEFYEVDNEMLEKPEVFFEFHNVELPTNAIGFKIEHKNEKGWFHYYGYGSWGLNGVKINKTNSSGKVKVKIGRKLTNGGSFKWVVKAKLKDKNTHASYIPGSGNYYYLEAKVKNKSGGAHSVTVYY